ncbi:hypothetical protein [Mycobacterium sp. E787]|uniref:hypothetical protein n=1 Tax=Mycobacterium sp. E787 TaxID=1834150 RepID=UPI0007FF3327|nr:hypothetical protein [Mycobacterium sp. E787]OBI53897.1 hypothetical protein A5705_00125 [Mycobacterium sp. E787]
MADDDDRASSPGTEAFVPDFDDDEDTGTQSFVPDFDDDTGSQPIPAAAAEEKAAERAPEPPAAAPGGEPGGLPVQPIAVPGRYLYLKWWQLVLVLLGVWAVSGPVGLGLFYWWHHSANKTAAAFTVLVYVVACGVGGVLLAMAEGRALLSALSLAVMSGPFASVAAAAPLYGYYFCERAGHCLAGVIPY